MPLSKYLLFLLMFFLTSDTSREALAYLDPGTGSMILQLLLGGIAGVIVVLKLYWQRFKSLFQSLCQKLHSRE